MSKLQIEYIDQSELHLNDDNVNVHPTKSIEKIAKSIEKFGFRNPIIIDKNNIVISGNGRLEAARMLMIDKIPCIRADDLTEEQLKAFAIADNRVAEDSFFDTLKLTAVMEELEEIGFDLDDLGFDEGEIQLGEISEDDFFVAPLDEGEEQEIKSLKEFAGLDYSSITFIFETQKAEEIKEIAKGLTPEEKGELIYKMFKMYESGSFG